MNQHHIKAVSIFDENYPHRLAQCHNAPTLLYVLGEAELNPPRAISIVGTRKPTPYGSAFCSKAVEELADACPDLTIVSGLAYGIDSLAHAGALKCGLPTIAVVAHGLDMIYPASHRDLAKNILKAGGALVSEYPSHTKPFRGNFLERNRIVAGLSDATLVVESDLRGGAMSTASLAFDYDRELFAVPGRISDSLSTGCNSLIQRNKAMLATSATDIVKSMQWDIKGVRSALNQATLFDPELTDEQRLVVDRLRRSDTYLSVDRLSELTNIEVPDLLPILFELELDGLIAKAPGNCYVHVGT